MAKNPSNDANVSRATLVAIVPLLIRQVTGVDFTAIKAKFPLKYADENYLGNLQTEADTVNDMPLPETRMAPRVETRSAMIAKLKDVTDGALSLKAYIATGFTADKVAAQLEACGYTPYFAKVGKKQFDVVDLLFNSMGAYMVTNQAVLESNGSMPKDFPAQMTALRAAFANLYRQYKVDNKASSDETGAFVNAISTLKTKVQGLCNDARLTFRSDKAKAATYAFDAFKKSATPQRTFAAIRSGFEDSVSQRPIVGAEVSTPYFNLKTMTNTKGRFELKPLPQGKYTLTVTLAGYETLVIANVEVQTGVLRTLPRTAMVKLLPGEDLRSRLVEFSDMLAVQPK